MEYFICMYSVHGLLIVTVHYSHMLQSELLICSGASGNWRNFTCFCNSLCSFAVVGTSTVLCSNVDLLQQCSNQERLNAHTTISPCQ